MHASNVGCCTKNKLESQIHVSVALSIIYLFADEHKVQIVADEH